MGADPVSLGVLAVSTGLQIYGQKKAFDAKKDYYNVERAVDIEKANQEYENAKYAILQAHEVLRQGQAKARQREVEGKQLQGRQLAEMAAMGVDVGSATATELKMQSAAVSAEDMLNITHDSELQAWGLYKEAEQHRKQAKLYLLSERQHKEAINNARSSFYLSSANTVLGAGKKAYNIFK